MKGQINKNNYEAWLLDYSEGNLDAESISVLKAFLIANPELSHNLDVLDLPILSPEKLNFKQKAGLKKEHYYSDEKLIAHMEGLLQGREKIEFENELEKNEAIKFELNRYVKTRLQIEEQEIFENKRKLQKTEEDFLLNQLPLAYFEKQLGAKEVAQFEKELLVDKNLANEVNLFSKTKLNPDYELVFADKHLLKKKPKTIPLFGFNRVAAIAAAIIFILGLYPVARYYLSDGNRVKVALKPMGINTEKNVNTLKENVQTNPLAVSKQNTPNSETEKSKNSQMEPKAFSKGQRINLPSALKSDSMANFFVQKEKTAGSNDKESIVKQTSRDSLRVQAENSFTTALAQVVPATTSNSISANINTSDNKISSAPVNENYQPVYTLAVVSDDNVGEEPPATSKKKRFWQRLVKVANKANDFGVKSLEGEETTSNSFLISFKGMSVEKR